MTHAQTKIKERPILFSGPMVRAILEGRKTQTRRACKPYLQCYDTVSCDSKKTDFDFHFRDGIGQLIQCPYGKPGDRLWVREAFVPNYFDGGRMGYKADWNETAAEYCPEPKWKPSIHMPRAASRILLEITDVRVERLQEISEEDALAEGVLENPNQDSLYDFWHYGGSGCWGEFNAVGSFNSLWESINGPESWEANPWVWVVNFKTVKP